MKFIGHTNQKKFGDATYLASFAPYHGKHAIFLGIWKIINVYPSCDMSPKKFNLIKPIAEKFHWNLAQASFYEMTKTEILADLSERLVIDWGGSTVSWVQKITSKPVIAILPLSSIEEFQSYEKTMLDRNQLVKMCENPTNNATWQNALSAVNGIYCITNKKTGKIYIGSAYGRKGIWGRWSNYAVNPDGGNNKLIDLLAKEPDAAEHFQYSILEILPGSSTQKDATRKENLWKEKMRSKENGYNSN